jgi:hypothetical protein
MNRLRPLLRPLERNKKNAFRRAFVHQFARRGIVFVLASAAITAAIAAAIQRGDLAAWLVLGSAAGGLAVALVLAWGLADDHQLATQVVLCDKDKVLPRMNTVAAEGGYVLASQHNDYFRYEEVESPGVGIKGFTLPGLSAVVQFSEKAATITGPVWIVENLVSAALAADPTARELKQDTHADS